MVCLKKPALLACMAFMAPGMASAQDQLIEASNILGGNISNGLETFGRIVNVLLDENSESVEYMFFSRSSTFSPTRDDKGFVEIENVDFAPGVLGELEVTVEDTDAQRKPQELEVTRSEAEYRLLSNILDESIRFSDQKVYEIDDLLIDRNTGKIEYFTIDMTTDSFFDEDIRAIPASDVEVSMSGQVSASVALSEVESNSRYQLSSR